MSQYDLIIETATGVSRLVPINEQELRDDQYALKAAQRLAAEFVGVRWFRRVTVWQGDRHVGSVRLQYQAVIEEVVG